MCPSILTNKNSLTCCRMSVQPKGCFLLNRLSLLRVASNQCNCDSPCVLKLSQLEEDWLWSIL